ncbi:hypothetical protein [Sporosarcina jiandibaonis]|uniref:hypothetical protein n=1 Tax=Sporosarcina jiandibaonis TaxID=2715535 RepID=UPI001552A52A|nr:hypothetical protein [Sporosarcina jiandibaonis]
MALGPGVATFDLDGFGRLRTCFSRFGMYFSRFTCALVVCRLALVVSAPTLVVYPSINQSTHTKKVATSDGNLFYVNN